LLSYVFILLMNASSVGLVRDEGYYFKAAEQYAGWWDTLFSSRFLDAFSDVEIKKHFSYNTEHPPLVKLSLGITHRVFYRGLGVLSESTAFRLTGILFAALSLLATFLLGRLLVSAEVGLIAALLLATVPRYFFDAHLACFDVPITALWTLSLWAFWRAFLSKGKAVWRTSVVAGLIFGFALATKLNALFLPFVFVLTWLWSGLFFKQLGLRKSASGGTDFSIGRIPWVLLICALLGPLVFYLCWPYLWHHPIERTNAYLAFHLNHEHYPISYFHELLSKPPFPRRFPMVMSFFTLPSPLLFLGATGAILAMARMLRRRVPSETFLVVALLLPLLLIAMPSTPIFGGVKHWYNAMPILAILAARSLVHGASVFRKYAENFPRVIVVTGLALLAALPGVLGIAASPATGIAYYSELAGGYRGGAELGLQRGFWGGLAHPNLRSLQSLKPGSRVFFNRLNYDSYRMYVREKQIPDRVYYANDAKNTAAAIHFEQPEHGEKEGEIWSVLGTKPVCGVYVDNVTLTQLYSKSPILHCK
jgi:4-amino-4-deoxy-L-arabinose transferase-like glycosyltransferase